LPGGDHDRRFFEASWMFKRNGPYYFTYSTGDTHFLAYAIGKSPQAPSSTKGISCFPCGAGQRITPSWNGVASGGSSMQDTQLSNKNHLRNVKVTELHFEADGSMRMVDLFTS
jgi:hypothetical protein